MTKLEKSLQTRPSNIVDPERLEPQAPLRELGRWYWVHEQADDEDGEAADRWLGCVTHVGSNYVQVSGVNGRSGRIHENEFDEICTVEPDADAIIRGYIGEHQEHVRTLMNNIRQLCAKLGVTRPELEETNAPAQALALSHGISNIKLHKEALILAKEKTLPDLFAQIKTAHSQMATWMQAQLLPLKAETEQLETRTEVIEDRIFHVELYAGLIEEMKQIKRGKPAEVTDKVHLFQRRCYMDEECLARYEAGGMTFEDIRDFDRWLVRKENLERLLPFPRCVVAFRVRRKDADRHDSGLDGFIKMKLEQADRATFLYIRNGGQVFRLSTEIDFGADLFPRREDSLLLGDNELWLKPGWGRTRHGSWSGHDLDIITKAQLDERKQDEINRLNEFEEELRKWQALRTKAARERAGLHSKPYYRYDDTADRYQRCDPGSVYYDDAMNQIAREAIQHNRVAVVLQGILDRSPALHPHPPWKLWTPEGFTSGIELVYDNSRVLAEGEAPDFELYRSRLNAHFKVGSYAVGQEDVWLQAMARKENERERNDYRIRHKSNYKRYRPYNNPGPGLVAEVMYIHRKTGACTFKWSREAMRRKFGPYVPSRPGYVTRHRIDYDVVAKFTCPMSVILNVSAYTPGDFRQFYDDPRTRCDYIKWAPLLLAAEDWHAGKGKSGGKPPLDEGEGEEDDSDD